MKKHFNELFSVQNEMVTPKTIVEISGVTMGPGVSMNLNGVAIGGITLFTLYGKVLEVENRVGGGFIITGYQQ